jgi:hypothetical protein
MTTNIPPSLRDALLALHKALVDAERVSYEQTIGAIQSPNQFLKLLTTDPWFAWLHPLSELIVKLDEAQDEKKPLTLADQDALLDQIRLLLVPSETGEGFSRHYYDAMQRDPDVVLAHAEVTKLLGSRKRPA